MKAGRELDACHMSSNSKSLWSGGRKCLVVA